MNSFEAAQPQRTPLTVAQQIDDILYGVDRSSGNDLLAVADGGKFNMRLALSYMHIDEQLLAWPELVNNNLDITHEIDRRRGYDRYDVSVDWQFDGTRVLPTLLPVTYTLELYGKGSVQASVIDADMGPEHSVSRQMTGRDLAQLALRLSILGNFQRAVQRDNHLTEQYLADQ